MTVFDYDAEIDSDTFDMLICDCYRRVHPPLQKKTINGKFVQRPYHYGEDWFKYNNMSWLEKLKLLGELGIKLNEELE
jgi:hypothetical protein